jgi:hypothetical protein
MEFQSDSLEILLEWEEQCLEVGKLEGGLQKKR